VKYRLLLLSSVAAITAWSPGSFAQQVINGATPTALSPTGVVSGVSMTGQGGGGTLLVGTTGGPETDIFTNNSSNGGATNPLLPAVSTDTSSLSNITFNSSSSVFGAIGTSQPGGPFFANIAAGNNGTVVNFFGDVFATTTTVNGTGTLNFDSGSTNITATNFAGGGTISLAPNTTLIGALTTNTANTGTLVLGQGSVLTGAVGGATGLKAVNVVGGSNNAGASASISGSVDAYSFNLGTNTLNVGGALSIANGGTGGVINTTLASPTVFGNIKTVGAASLGPTLDVDVTVPSTAFLPVGTVFDIVKAQSGTNGSVVTVINDPTNPLYTFAPVPLAGTTNGQVAIEVTGIPLLVPVAPPPGVPLPPVLPIAAPIVPVLLTAAGAAAPGSDLLVNVLPAINALSNPAAVVLAIAQLAPSTPDLAAPLVTFEGTREFQNLWSSRVDCGEGRDDWNSDDKRHHDENATCPDSDARYGLWAKGFGYFGDQGAEGADLGYDSKIYGGMVGFDAPLGNSTRNDDTRAGLGLGYARSTIDGKTFLANTDSNTYAATAYISHESHRWFLNGDLSFGYNEYSGARQILFPGINRTANAKYDGEDGTAFASTGYRFYADGFTLTPFASLQYTYMNLRGYTETGAGDIDLIVRPQTYRFLESGLGTKLSHRFDTDDGTAVLPEVHFKWLYEIENPTASDTAAFTATGSSQFTTPGLKPAANTFDVGAGITLLSCGCGRRSWSVAAVYDYYWRTDDYSAQAVMLKFRWSPGGEAAPVAYQAPPPPPLPPPPPPPPAPVKTFIVFFDFNKSDLTPEAQNVVSEAVKAANETGAVRILITGHTDTVGSDSYNQALSQRRADAVKGLMIHEGMRAEEISTVGKSFHDPLVATGPDVREPQNRRAVIDLGS
jgi:outer membrane autotransporter protein